MGLVRYSQCVVLRNYFVNLVIFVPQVGQIARIMLRPFDSFFHRCLGIVHSLLLLTFHTIHFSQSIFPPLSVEFVLAHSEAIKGFANSRIETS